ncbi:FAD-dependent oxidoreductase [Nonomuraea cavernae]|uniref:Flavocytochrome c n=1 Tax=Nonomuraea cavernae TaxID=2045107 RepID=A0A917YSJ9_9ACTN|nr:FAD-dependent oxidoreductase [Nonomuraea cavernae]MCA2185048.1 FAD-dependent oxidoreductase [Nonomuraea cavernae]GGO65253.1 flavocytochrome c [Nonomuraea cavernae]
MAATWSADDVREPEPPATWDAIVVGAGPGGLACAIAAADAGARVLLLEKADDVGGALHFSGGHLSAGGFSAQYERGIEDDPERHLADIRRISRGTAREDLTRVSLAEQPAVLEWLLAAGFAIDPATPRIVHGHEPYLTPRTVHASAVPGGPAILAVLRPLLAAHQAAGRIDLRCGVRITDLLTAPPTSGARAGNGPATGAQDGDGRVTGVVAEDGTRWRAGAVVLATGGFGFAPELFAELEGAPLTTSAAPTSTGDGLLMGRRAGAAVQGTGRYIPTFGGLPPEGDDPRVDWTHRPQLVAVERPPWEIYVDPRGRRWIAEDEPSIDRKERALTTIERMTFWMVFDERALRESYPIVHGWSAAELAERCGRRRGVHRAGDLGGLAELAGIDREGLLETVARYNGFVAGGRDPDFGRRHLPAPIAEPPYYAIENHPVTLITFAGLDVDTRSRVRRADGQIIPGLYAVGEVIGSAAVNGNAFCSGMCLTPAMAFGRLVGRDLAGRRGIRR